MTDRERHEDETLKNCIQEAYGCSDDQLLAELAEIDKTLSESDLPGVEDRIMSRLKARMAEEETEKKIEVNPEADKVSVAQVEESESETTTEVETAPCVEVQEKKVVRIGKKKIALVAVLAAAFVGVLGGTTIGNNNYFLRKDKDKTNTVLDSGKNMIEVGDLREAYSLVENELQFSALKVNYMPENTLFENLVILDSNAFFTFSYNDEKIYLIQAKKNKEVSVGISSDRSHKGTIVHNSWISQDILLEENLLEDGNIEYSATLYDGNISCIIVGILPREEIVKIIEYLNY